MRAGLARRMVVASGLLALVVGSAFAVLLVSITDLHEAERDAARSQQVLVVAHRLERLFADAETGLRGFVATGDEGFLQPWRAARDAFPERATALREAVAGNPGQLARAQRLTRMGRSYLRDYAVPLVAARRGPTGGAADRMIEEGRQRVDALQDEFDRLVATEDALAATRQAQSDTDTNRAIVAAAAGMAGSVLLIVAFAAYLSRAIARPVRGAADMAGRLAGGDLTVRLPERGPGEVGALERSFNTMASSLQESRDELGAMQARIVTATDQARRRIERDLHDGLQQRLVSLALDLRATQATVPADLAELKTRLAGVADGLAGATDELRELSHGIHPAILSERGLPPALKALARRSPVPVELDVDVPGRLPEQLEVAAYYVVAEALTNAAKHAHASVVRVDVRTQDGSLHTSVRDDGIGGASLAAGSGLVGLADRVRALGGTISITSDEGHGTHLSARLPAES